MTKEELIRFEDEMADIYATGKIRAHMHLSGGNEDYLIGIFKDVAPDDWVFSTWRSHYHALLHGVPAELVKEEIVRGNSITMCFPEYRFFSSAIVGGIIPIAVGTALAIKKKGEKRHVWCFVGDMTAESGIFYENVKYAAFHDLPITFVVEDNSLAISTPTDTAWGYDKDAKKPDYLAIDRGNVRYYKYERTRPHVGIGKWIDF